ncbi:MAG: AmmeMemoRadiSam system radical SAM enzyme [Bacteroidales bacterium]
MIFTIFDIMEQSGTFMTECSYYRKREAERVQCLLCPHSCSIPGGGTGLCGVRHNIEGMLMTNTFSHISSLSADPVEKKPLYHFYPGSSIYSVGSYGCNLTCSFCQNHEISQVRNVAYQTRSGRRESIERILEAAEATPGNVGLAFTYNEPVVWIEFVLELALAAAGRGMKTAMVSNGFINSAPLTDLTAMVDAFNIDLKGFSEKFYREHTGGRLKPVLESIAQIAAAQRHLEITMLVIEGLNDDDRDIEDAFRWIADNAGRETPLHLSRYFPRYRMNLPPTDVNKLLRMREMAMQYLDFVYTGNLPFSAGQNTHCPRCGNLITTRDGYIVTQTGVRPDGSCAACGREIYHNFAEWQR